MAACLDVVDLLLEVIQREMPIDVSQTYEQVLTQQKKMPRAYEGHGAVTLQQDHELQQRTAWHYVETLIRNP